MPFIAVFTPLSKINSHVEVGHHSFMLIPLISILDELLPVKLWLNPIQLKQPFHKLSPKPSR